MDRDYLEVSKRDDMSDEENVLRLRIDTEERVNAEGLGVSL